MIESVTEKSVLSCVTFYIHLHINKKPSTMNFKSIALILLMFSFGGGLTSLRKSSYITQLEECKPRPILININNRTFSNAPQYMKVYRCIGFDVGYAANYRCVNTSTQLISVRTSSLKRLHYNHTGCAMKCACEDQLKCQTPKAKARDVFCYPGYKWSTDKCICESTSLQQSGSLESNEHKENVVSLKVFVFSLIGEFLIVATLIHCFHNSKSQEPEHCDEDEDIDISVDYLKRSDNSLPNATDSIKQFLNLRKENPQLTQYDNFDSPSVAARKISVRHTYSY